MSKKKIYREAQRKRWKMALENTLFLTVNDVQKALYSTPIKNKLWWDADDLINETQTAITKFHTATNQVKLDKLKNQGK